VAAFLHQSGVGNFLPFGRPVFPFSSMIGSKQKKINGFVRRAAQKTRN
jgi:hypothetical protein